MQNTANDEIKELAKHEKQMKEAETIYVVASLPSSNIMKKCFVKY
jgi:hypothetical protein